MLKQYLKSSSNVLTNCLLQAAQSTGKTFENMVFYFRKKVTCLLRTLSVTAMTDIAQKNQATDRVTQKGYKV